VRIGARLGRDPHGSTLGRVSDTTPGIERRVVLEVELPAPRTVSRIQARRITIAAGTPTGVHEHNGPVVGVILAGSAIVRIDGGAEVVLGPGEPFSEPEATRIDRFDAGDDGLEFMAFFPVGPGEEPTLTPLAS
jgi:quercetin dioxygenase-like cupin family protein